MTALADLFSVRDKIVLVTGGSRGIGALIARAFAESSARVYITSRKAADCEHTAVALGERGWCEALPADLSDPAEIQRLVSRLRERESRLDVLVNNAGTTWGAPLAEYPIEAWDRVFSLNVRAMFQLTRDLIPLLTANASLLEPARVINLSSVAGDRVAADTYAYAYGASKSAVNHPTRILAMELAGKFVTVNAVSPGVFPSRMTSHKVGAETMLEIAGRATPLGRPGSLEDIAGACLFLASRAGAYLMGAVLPLDGGMHTKPVQWRGEDA